MSVALISSGVQEDVNTGSPFNIVLPAPSSIASGDLRVHWLCNVHSSSNIPGAGSGMSDIGGAGDFTDLVSARAQYKVAGGSEGSITHTVAASFTSLGYAFRATGINPAAPINVAATTNSVGESTSGVAIPTVTTTVDNCLIVYLVMLGASTPTISGPTLLDTFWNNGGDVGAVYYETKATAGTTTARTLTWSGGATEVAIAVFAIAPEPPATTAPSAPSQPDAVEGHEAVLVEWTAPADGGSPITGYKIERNINSAGWTTVVADTGNLRLWYFDQGLTNGVPVNYRVSAINAIGTGSASTAAGEVTPTFAAFPTVVSANGRYIEDQNGDFWPMLGDAGGLWAQIANDTILLQYLDNLAAAGFNLWRTRPIQEGSAAADYQEDAETGTEAFTGTYWTTALDGPYWDRVEWMTAQAYVRGITNLVEPFWLGIDSTQGCAESVSAQTNGTIEGVGEDVGERFAIYPNVIWAFGGDRDPSTTHSARTNAFIDGVKTSLTAESREHLMTFQGDPDTIAGSFVGDITSIDSDVFLNGVYDYGITMGEYVTAYGQDVGPMHQMEGAYQNEHSSTFVELRRQSWWPIVCGGVGAIFGNAPRYHFGLDGGPGTLAETFDDPDGTFDRGTQDFTVFATIMQAQRGLLINTAPDTTGTFVTSGTAEGVYADDGALVYATATSTLVIDLTEFTTSAVNITRYDPVSGASTLVVEEQTTSGQSAFTGLQGQGNNSSGDSDWVFVFEGVALATGTGSPSTTRHSASGSGSTAAPSVSGSSSATLSRSTASGTGSTTVPSSSGTGSPTLVRVSATGSGSTTVPGETGSGATTLTRHTATGIGSTGTTGSSTTTLTRVSATGSGSATSPSLAGTGSLALTRATSSGTGSTTTPSATGTSATTLAARTVVGAGVSSPPAGIGAGSPALERHTATGAGSAGIVGAGSPTTAARTASGAGSTTLPSDGFGSLSLSRATASGSGATVSPSIGGSGSPACTRHSASGTGSTGGLSGTAGVTLLARSASGAGSTGVRGASSGILNPKTAGGTGLSVSRVTGTGSLLLERATLFGTSALVADSHVVYSIPAENRTTVIGSEARVLVVPIGEEV